VTASCDRLRPRSRSRGTLHDLLLGADRLGLTQLANLDKLPDHGRDRCGLPAQPGSGTGCPSRVFVFVPSVRI
jgi:kynurenine formamidase